LSSGGVEPDTPSRIGHRGNSQLSPYFTSEFANSKLNTELSNIGQSIASTMGKSNKANGENIGRQ
jgi:hypothetical protein